MKGHALFSGGGNSEIAKNNLSTCKNLRTSPELLPISTKINTKHTWVMRFYFIQIKIRGDHSEIEKLH